MVKALPISGTDGDSSPPLSAHQQLKGRWAKTTCHHRGNSTKNERNNSKYRTRLKEEEPHCDDTVTYPSSPRASHSAQATDAYMLNKTRVALKSVTTCLYKRHCLYQEPLLQAMGTPPKEDRKIKSIMEFSRLKRWYHTVRRDRTLGNIDPRGPFKVLPPELLLIILEELPLYSYVSLALTCRPFHQVLGPTYPQLRTNGDREDFLQILERDLPGWHFCFGCVQLHRWKPSRPPFTERWPKVCAEFVFRNPLLGIQHDEFIGYSDARLVMRRHRHGVEYGIPAQKLDLDFSIRKKWRTGVRTELTREARIINGELYLRTVGEFWHPHGDTLGLRRHLEANKICNHICMRPGNGEYSPLFKVPEVMAPNSASELMSCDSASASCPWCMTDYTISVTWAKRGALQGWVVDLVIYYLLGDCRSPFEWKWRSICERSCLNEPRYLKHPPGVVKRQWHGSEARTDEELAQGEEGTGLREKFIGIPTYGHFVPGTRRCRWYLPDHSGHSCATFGKDEVWSKRGWGHDM